MNVQELIDALQKVENKNKTVQIASWNFQVELADVRETANLPKRTIKLEHVILVGKR